MTTTWKASNSLPETSPGHETLYVGIDIGKRSHVAGFLSTTLLARHRRFEHCPALSFENSREGFRRLVDRIQSYVPLTQVYLVHVRYNLGISPILSEWDSSNPMLAGFRKLLNQDQAWIGFAFRREECDK